MATETGSGEAAAGAEAVAPSPKPKLDTTGAEWLSARQEDGSPGDVQIAFVDGYIAMRDGRFPDGPVLVFTQAEWDAFVLGAQDGEFDLD
ncbi:DUF397 domain-containing protein [Kitasatospora acidiphila]|uniref:DUF397 domain-containing protein n=1 Tax=Kitasatospora acidiphila TaxID=2567942 RepID=A0A540WC25_9ACTN|nr:hypothetical protein [Kitasatospora sp. GP30]TQF06502.1 DUF397 domain-containing protein [Kitasatospora acidiphila]